MNSTLSRLKAWQQRQAKAAYRTRNQRIYIFAWLMITGAIRSAFFEYEDFWIDLVAILAWLFVGDFIGSKTYPLFRRFALRFRSPRN
jgi:hypothetical protein